MEQNQQDRDQEQEALARKFLLIPFEVMLDERLTLADKAVFGRALYFHRHFESAERTAAFIGISADQVRKSKQKLEKLGLIHCIKNDGRGKEYIAELEPGRLVKSSNRLERLGKSTNQTRKNSEADSENQLAEKKRSSNGEERSFCDKSQKDASDGESEQINDEKPKRYGNAEVNDALDLWEHETGFNHHSTKSERYAIAGLIKQHGYEPTKALIKRVGIATRSRDRFAPQIAKPSQLRGKYSKLEALVQWERRQDYRDPDQPNLRKLYETPEEYQRPEPEDTTTKEQRHANVEAIREQYRGTKYETIFCRRKAGDK